MGAKLCPKIILEGTRLTRKTDIAFALDEHPRVVGPRKYRYHSPLVSAEWCAFTNFPWGRGLINYAPEEEAQARETYATWARLFELQPYYSWIVDRFHLSTRAFHIQAGRPDPDFAWLEARLVPLGFRHVLCVRRPDTFAAARAERLKVSGNPGQYDDLTPFVREQELLRRLVRASALPHLELDISDLDADAAADRIADWLEATGGLSAPWGVTPAPAPPPADAGAPPLVVPDTFVTARLVAARPRVDDAAAVFAAYAHDATVTRHLSWRTHERVDTVSQYLHGAVDAWARGTGHRAWLLRRRDTGALVGSIGLTQHGPRVEFGYVLARAHWRQGLATEALTWLVDWALAQPGIARAGAVCDVDNPASARVMEKVGMAREGVLRRWMVAPNIGPEPRDCLVYAKIRGA